MSRFKFQFLIAICCAPLLPGQPAPARVAGGDVVLLACPVDADPVYLITRPEIKSAAELKGQASAVARSVSKLC